MGRQGKRLTAVAVAAAFGLVGLPGPQVALAAPAFTATVPSSAATVATKAAATHNTTDDPGSYNGLDLTPQLGYDDWNAYGCNVSAQLMDQTALAMHNNGMQAAGYQFVNIDDCWILGRNATEIPAGQTKATVGRGSPTNPMTPSPAADDQLIPDPNYFPPSTQGANDGIALVANYVHSLGLKFGIYNSAGTATCQGLAGTLSPTSLADSYQVEDADTYAGWGVDYLKEDNCNIPSWAADTQAGYQQRYAAVSAALLATGRPIVYEICISGGTNDPWLWGPAIANSWRTTSDIEPTFASMLSNFTGNSVLAAYAGPGHWNDPDMLEPGTGTMTTLAAAAPAGTTTIHTDSVGSAIIGGAIIVGTAAAGDLDSDTVTAVGTAAGKTTLSLPASAGATTVYVPSVSAFSVGEPIIIGSGANVLTSTVTAVGTPAQTTTLATAASAGATNVQVSSVTPFTIGGPITFVSGSTEQTATVSAVGTAAVATTLSGATTAGATSISVASANDLSVGDTLGIDSGANYETATISAIGTASFRSTPVTLTSGLEFAHASGALVVDLSKLGTGVTFSPALSSAVTAGAGVVGNPGTGVSFSPALSMAEPAGTAASGLGTGITLQTPLVYSHPSGEYVDISGLTNTASQSMLSLWSMEAAPLIVGTDVVDLASQNLGIYTNSDVLGVDQDPLGVQAAVLSNANGQWVLEKPLANGSNAVALFNASTTTPWTGATASFSSLGLQPGSTNYVARNLWTHATTEITDPLTVSSIPAEGTAIYTISSASCHSGTVNGGLKAGSGQTVCLLPGAVVNGPVNVSKGGTFVAEGATINGPLQASGATAVTVCSSSLHGPLSVSGTTGMVLVGGDAATPSCGGNTIAGPADVTGNTIGGVEFNGNTVRGPVTITNNTGTLPAPDSGSFQATGNSVSGPSTIGNAPSFVASSTATLGQGPGATMTAGSQSTVTIKANGTPMPSFTEKGVLPSGVTFTDNHNGTATLAGTPALSSGGIYPVSITVSNGIAPSASETFALTVLAVPLTSTTGAVTGMVTNSNGQPLANICVELYPVQSPAGADTVTPEGMSPVASYSTCTSPKGTYEIDGVAPTEVNTPIVFYDVKFVDPTGTYPTQWYNGTNSATACGQGCAWITVSAGLASSGINAIMSGA